MKKKQTLTQKTHIECSSCLRCAWRSPLTGEPRRCLLGILDFSDTDSGHLPSHPHCDRYIRDDVFERHINQLLHIDSDLIDEIRSELLHLMIAKIEIPTALIPDIVELLRKRGYTPNDIRRVFGLRKMGVSDFDSPTNEGRDS